METQSLTDQKNQAGRKLFRFVKVLGHKNWFLVLEAGEDEPDSFSEIMQEKRLRVEELELFFKPKPRIDYVQRLVKAATYQIDYQKLANKYGTLLIRPIGSYMPLDGYSITDETFDTDFPIDDFAEIVICENDKNAEYKWVQYLKKRFPNKKIVTINYFDLRSENEVIKYFEKAQYITFSTTFSSYEWFKKLAKFTNSNHKIIGYCHNAENWNDALEINKNIEIIETID